VIGTIGPKTVSQLLLSLSLLQLPLPLLLLVLLYGDTCAVTYLYKDHLWLANQPLVVFQRFHQLAEEDVLISAKDFPTITSMCQNKHRKAIAFLVALILGSYNQKTTTCRSLGWNPT